MLAYTPHHPTQATQAAQPTSLSPGHAPSLAKLPKRGAAWWRLNACWLMVAALLCCALPQAAHAQGIVQESRTVDVNIGDLTSAGAKIYVSTNFPNGQLDIVDSSSALYYYQSAQLLSGAITAQPGPIETIGGYSGRFSAILRDSNAACAQVSTVVLSLSPDNTQDPSVRLTLTLNYVGPQVTSVMPNAGSVAGGAVISIAGCNLGDATQVTVGGVPVTSFTRVNANLIRAVTPAGTVGNADVRVTAPAGSSGANPQFTYQGGNAINFTSAAPAPAQVGGATYTPVAASTSGLAVALTLDASSTGCAMAAGVLSFPSAGVCRVNANQAGNGSFAAAPQVQQIFLVGANSQIINFTTAAPTAQRNGDHFTYFVSATATSGLPVTLSLDSLSAGCLIAAVSGVYSVQFYTANGNVGIASSGICRINANQPGNGSFIAAAQVQQSFVVYASLAPAQNISFTSAAPTAAAAGGATYTPVATSTAGLVVAFTLDASSTGCSIASGVVSFTGLGTCKVNANQAGDFNNLPAAQVQQSFAVAGVAVAQAINFNTAVPAAAQAGGATYTPAALATSALPVAFALDASSTGCSMAAGVVSFTGAGTCKVNASQPGNAGFLAAPQVQQSFAVAGVAVAQTINFTSAVPAAAQAGGATYTPVAVATSALAVAFALDASSTGCSLAAGVVSFTGVGTCRVNANQPGNAAFLAAPQVQQSFAVAAAAAPLAQTIAFTSAAPAAAQAGGATYTPVAAATSALAVAFALDASSTGCAIAAGVVSFTGAGTCKVNANQAGNGSFLAAAQVQQSFAVAAAAAAQTINFTSTAPTAAVAGGATYAAVATATSGLAVALTLDGASTGCTLAAGVLSFTGAGTCKVNANQPGNGSFAAAAQKQQSFAVAAAAVAQTINFTSAAPGAAVAGGATYTPVATASSGLTPTLTLDASSTGCSMAAGVVSFTGAGTCKVNANQPGNAGFTAAAQVQQSFAVAAAAVAQTIAFTSQPPAMPVIGGPTYAPTATASSGLVVALSIDAASSACTITGGVVRFTSAGACVINANQAGNASFRAAVQVQQTMTVRDAVAATAQAIAAFNSTRANVLVFNLFDMGRGVQRLNANTPGGPAGSPAPPPTLAAAGGDPRKVAALGARNVAGNAGGNVGDVASSGGYIAPRAAQDPFGLEQMVVASIMQLGRTGKLGDFSLAGPIKGRLNLNGAPTGSFKTSLVDLGLAPVLRAQGDAPEGSGSGSGSGSGDGSGDGSVTKPFDMWLEGTVARISAAQPARYGQLSMGADYVLSPKLLVGGFVQSDVYEDLGPLRNRGTGWLAGPYATVRLVDQLFLELRGGYGQSTNNLTNPLMPTMTDSFGSQRLLASVGVSGRWQVNPSLLFNPKLAYTYFEDTTRPYTSLLGVDIPSVSTKLAQFKLTPAVVQRFDLAGGSQLELSFAPDVAWNLATTTAAGLGPLLPTAATTDRMRTSLTGGLAYRTRGGIKLSVSGTYDGVGSSTLRAYRTTVLVQVPIR